MKSLKIALLLVFCCLWILSRGQNPKTNYIQLDGLEVAVTGDFRTNSHLIDGILQTSFRKEGSSLTSMLVIGVLDVGTEMDDELLSGELVGLRESFQSIGFTMEPYKRFTSKTHCGYKSEGTGVLMDIPVRVVSKVCGVSHFFVNFLEYYGADYSEDYERIEESMRISTKAKLTGIQTISNNGYSFNYNADNMIAITNNTETETMFTFTSTDANSSDSFLEFNFTTKDIGNFYAYANTWFSQMVDLFSKTYAKINFTPMERVTFFGQPGYLRKGIGILNLSAKQVKITLKVCRYKGKFVWSVAQQSLDDDEMPLADIDEQFKKIENSMIVIP